MYPHEMMDYLQSKKYELEVINVNINTHLTHVKYNPYSNSYEMLDRYGNFYNFRVKGENEND